MPHSRHPKQREGRRLDDSVLDDVLDVIVVGNLNRKRSPLLRAIWSANRIRPRIRSGAPPAVLVAQKHALDRTERVPREAASDCVDEVVDELKAIDRRFLFARITRTS